MPGDRAVHELRAELEARERETLVVEHKGTQDFVSHADRVVEALIAKRLAAAFPGDAFLGAYLPIVERRKDTPWTEAERRWLTDWLTRLAPLIMLDDKRKHQELGLFRTSGLTIVATLRPGESPDADEQACAPLDAREVKKSAREGL